MIQDDYSSFVTFDNIQYSDGGFFLSLLNIIFSVVSVFHNKRVFFIKNMYKKY